MSFSYRLLFVSEGGTIMNTKNLRFSAVLLILWLAAAALIPYSHAAGGLTVEVQQNTGFTADAVGVNRREESMPVQCAGCAACGRAGISRTAVRGNVRLCGAGTQEREHLRFSLSCESLPFPILQTEHGPATPALMCSGPRRMNVCGGLTRGNTGCAAFTVDARHDFALSDTGCGFRTIRHLLPQISRASRGNTVALRSLRPVSDRSNEGAGCTPEGTDGSGNGQPGERPLSVAVHTDRGADADETKTVKRGGDVSIRASAKRGYKITQIRLDNGAQAAAEPVSEGRIWLDGKAYRIDRDGGRVTLHLTDVQSDFTVRFLTGLDEDHIPVTVSEGAGVVIDKDCGSSVRSGTDAQFTISPQKNYRLSRITLSVDGVSRTVEADAEAIRVSGTGYRLRQDGDSVILYVDDIRAPVRVSAAAVKLSAYDNRIGTGNAENCRITASRAGVGNGGTAVYTVTPDKGYLLETVTLHIGSRKETAAAADKTIRVNGKAYSMSLSESGVLTVTVTGIRNDVTLDACAVREKGRVLYLRDGITGPYFAGVGAGLFQPESTLTRAEAAVMLARLTNYSPGAGYPSSGAADVPSGGWYTREVDAFYASGIVSGGWFRPQAPVTRGELAVWLYRLSGSPAVLRGASPFPDLPVHGEQHDTVVHGVQYGWLSGYPDGMFRPGAAITRAEAAKLINRVTGRPRAAEPYETTFADVPAAHWAYREIMSAANYVR